MSVTLVAVAVTILLAVGGHPLDPRARVTTYSLAPLAAVQASATPAALPLAVSPADQLICAQQDALATQVDLPATHSSPGAQDAALLQAVLGP